MDGSRLAVHVLRRACRALWGFPPSIVPLIVERRLESWSGLDDRALRRRLHGALAEAGLHVEALWADRILALATGTPPIDADEARLAHVIGMVETMNTIANDGGARKDEAHDPVNKDTAVKREHAALRAATPV